MFLSTKILIVFFSLNLILSLDNDSKDYQHRISILNFGLDYSKFSDQNELYRSISIIPFYLENNMLELGFYLNPFCYEEFDFYGDYKKNKLIDSYLLNFRFRYLPFEFNDKSRMFLDLALTDGKFFNWKNLKIYWLELGFAKRLNYASKINFGYRMNIYTNSNIKMNGVFLNLIFGYSYLVRKR